MTPASACKPAAARLERSLHQADMARRNLQVQARFQQDALQWRYPAFANGADIITGITRSRRPKDDAQFAQLAVVVGSHVWRLRGD